MQRPKKHLSFGSLVGALHEIFNGLEDKRQRHRIKYTLSDIGLSAFCEEPQNLMDLGTC